MHRACYISLPTEQCGKLAEENCWTTTGAFQFSTVQFYASAVEACLCVCTQVCCSGSLQAVPVSLWTELRSSTNGINLWISVRRPFLFESDVFGSKPRLTGISLEKYSHRRAITVVVLVTTEQLVLFS